MSLRLDSFRYLEEITARTSADGLAGDEAIGLAVSEGTSPPTLRLYRYRPSVIVGRFQNLTDAVDLDACKRRDHEWNRRHTGGGTVVMGPDQLALGLALPETHGSPGTIRKHFQFFAGLLADALAEFGIGAGLEGKNDLQIQGRKVAGLAVSQDIEGVVFFHCSLLLDFDVALMVDVLNLPTRCLDDRGQSCFSQRMTTVHEHAPGVTFDEMKAAVVRSLERRLGATAEPGGWRAHEVRRTRRLKRKRYENDAWIYSSRVMRRWTGTADCKTPGGNLRVYVDRTSGTLDAVLITGDYFCRSLEIASFEARLLGIPARWDSVLSVIAEAGCEGIYRVAPSVLADLILSAAEVRGSRVRQLTGVAD